MGNRLQMGSKDGRFVSFGVLLRVDGEEDSFSLNDTLSDNDFSLCAQFMLTAVIVHHGGDEGGHYTTYKRSTHRVLEWRSLAEFERIERESEWYHISDEFDAHSPGHASIPELELSDVQS